MTPPRSPFVTAPSSIPWWAVLSCDPDLIRHHFSFIHFAGATGTVVFFVFNSLIPFITNGNTCASVVLFAMGSLRIRREEGQRLESPTF